MDVLPGTAVTLWVDFVGPTSLLIADSSSVTYSLYGQVGSALLTDQAIQPNSNATGVSIAIAGTHHSIASGLRFEKRTLVTTWETLGQTYTARTTYRVAPLTPYTAREEDVRIFFGLGEDELRDSEIDLFDALLRVEDATSKALVATALASGTILEVRANEAIVLTAAQRLIPSLKNRVANAISSGTDKFQRFRDTPDFAALEQQLTDRLGEALRAVGGGSDAVIPTIMAFSLPVDAVTAA